ncbi:MAG: DMT family transporter [Proteobacteria bacterium]|nr:DMT family transporter [Pseudomonadota bacterium]
MDFPGLSAQMGINWRLRRSIEAPFLTSFISFVILTIFILFIIFFIK